MDGIFKVVGGRSRAKMRRWFLWEGDCRPGRKESGRERDDLLGIYIWLADVVNEVEGERAQSSQPKSPLTFIHPNALHNSRAKAE